MPPVTLEQVLACPTFPTLPTVALKVLEIVRDPDADLQSLARTVQNDQALSARILRAVNSSFYGLATPCPTISRAVNYLGFCTVKSLVLGFSLVEFTRVGDGELDLVDYWRRCICSAAAARAIASTTATCDAEEAFLAALMQDIGMLAIHNALGKPYSHILAQTHGDHAQLCSIEQRDLGFDHARVGAQLCRRWRLPEPLARAVEQHHSSSSAAAAEGLARMVALSNLAAAALTVSDATTAVQMFRQRCADWLGIDAARVGLLLSEIQQQAGNLSDLLQVNIGQPADLNAIRAKAEEISLEHQLQVQKETQALRQSNSVLEKIAITDALTGAFNRKHFDAHLPMLFEAAQCTGGSVALIMFDADEFKSINDSHGHQAGDVVLTEIARRMQQHVRKPALLCRYGGEEFAIIAPGMTTMKATQLAESIRTSIARTPVDVSSLGLTVTSLRATVSAGVAAYQPASLPTVGSAQELLMAADLALMSAKRSGRNVVRAALSTPVAVRAAG